MSEKNQDQIAWTLGRYANGKILGLQRAYCKGHGPEGARARKALAELRRASSGTSWLSVGEAVFDGWPAEKLAEQGFDASDELRAITAVRSALRLYAVLQQSSQEGKALVLPEGVPDEEKRARRTACSFGRACRMIDPAMESDAGIRQDLLALETADEFEVVLYRMRTLVHKMRSSENAGIIKLDFARLTHDLYLIQLGVGFRERVMREWSKGFFIRPSKKNESAQTSDGAAGKQPR